MAYYIEGYSTPTVSSGKSSKDVNYGRDNYRNYVEIREDRLTAEDRRRRNNRFIYNSVNTDEPSDVNRNSNTPTTQNESQKYKWPMMNTKDPERIRKEKRLHTLMSDVDDLMRNVGLADQKFNPANFTYEVYTKGNQATNNNASFTAQKRNVAPKRAGNPRSFKPTKRKCSEEFDPFVDELVNILDDCDFKF